MTPASQAFQAHALLLAVLAIPGQRWVVLHFRIPSAKEEQPEADKVPVATLRFSIAPDGTVSDESGAPGAEGLISALGLALSAGGNIVVRQELELKVQRRLPNGKMGWEPQEKLYGAELADGDWAPVSERRLKKSFAFDPGTGKALPPVAGRSFGELQKPRVR